MKIKRNDQIIIQNVLDAGVTVDILQVDAANPATVLKTLATGISVFPHVIAGNELVAANNCAIRLKGAFNEVNATPSPIDVLEENDVTIPSSGSADLIWKDEGGNPAGAIFTPATGAIRPGANLPSAFYDDDPVNGRVDYIRNRAMDNGEAIPDVRIKTFSSANGKRLWDSALNRTFVRYDVDNSGAGFADSAGNYIDLTNTGRLHLFYRFKTELSPGNTSGDVEFYFQQPASPINLVRFTHTGNLIVSGSSGSTTLATGLSIIGSGNMVDLEIVLDNGASNNSFVRVNGTSYAFTFGNASFDPFIERVLMTRRTQLDLYALAFFKRELSVGSTEYTALKNTFTALSGA